MKKLFLMFSFILLLATKIFGQAAVDIIFSATDSAYYSLEINVGLDLSATNCIDTQLGEWDIPIFPEPGMFDIRFDLTPYGCPGLSTYMDYRAPGDPPAFPYTGMIVHTLWFQTSSRGLPIYLIYNLPFATTMTITDHFGGSVLDLGPFAGQGIAVIPDTYTYWFSKALLIMQYDNIVPIELISFKSLVLQNARAVQLDWTTATETNNSGFEILRCTQNDNEWRTIGFVPGFGTTTEPKSYSFTDEDVTTGTYKYRLKQIDFDGSFEFSNEIEVQVDFTPKEFVLYQNYPNPFNPSTVISYQLPVSGNVTLKVFDILGNEVATLVNEEKQTGVYEVEFNASGLTSGIYFYQLKAGSYNSIKKMVLLK